MSFQQVLLAILAWIVLSALFPLFFNSVERLYQKEIDRVVSGALTFGVAVLWRVLQLIVIVIMLPTIVLVTALEITLGTRRVEALCNSSRFTADLPAGVKAVLGRNFPRVIRVGLSHFFNKEQP
jgi:hypothetical protein